MRLESYIHTTDPVKRMRVRTFGKKVSKVKTQLAVLRKGEQDYVNGHPGLIISNREKFNAHDKAYDKVEGWVGTKRVKPVRGAMDRIAIRAEISSDALDNMNTLLREVLKFKRITHEKMLADYKGFEAKRQVNLERIDALLRRAATNQRKDLLRKLKKKWKYCKAHCRYVVSTNIYHDFTGQNNAHSIRWRAIKIGSIVVDKVYGDGGLFFNRAQCAGLQAWRDANVSMS